MVNSTVADAIGVCAETRQEAVGMGNTHMEARMLRGHIAPRNKGSGWSARLSALPIGHGKI
jgi:hypothetical protein